MMTREEIRKRVAKIRRIAGDFESAHSEEDRLRHDVLRAIADDERVPVDVREAARLALSTAEIDFPRYCA